MHEQIITTKVLVCQYDELDPETRHLIDVAKQMTNNSHSPYSKFRVGAAIQMADGEIFCGSNQENAAYPSGLCAERTTAFYASAQRPDTPMKAIALATFANGDFLDESAAPCAACRQVLLEYEHKFHQPMKVILWGKKQTYIFESVASLVPFCFTEDDLK